MSSERIGDFLVRKRREAGLRQGDVAAALGLTQPGYSNIERGNVRVSVKHLEKLAEVLKVEEAELIDRVVGLLTETERAIISDPLLATKQARRLVLLVYGELTGRDSVKVDNLYGERSD